LTNTDEPITTIAQSLGYESESAFSTNGTYFGR
jgi:AraC-like DNA-binding protein